MHALLFEEEETDRLVALRGNVHHIEAILIVHVEVCAVVDQSLADIDVSTE